MPGRDATDLDFALKQRLVGAIVLMALAVIFLPMLLDGSGTPETLDVEVEIPERGEKPESRFEEPDVTAGLDDPVEGGETESEPPETVTDDVDAESGTDVAAVTGWVVQVGSFTRESNALVLRDRLRDDDYAAFVQKGESDGNTVWRVRVGPVPEESEAREIAQQLEAERGKPALVMSHP